MFFVVLFYFIFCIDEYIFMRIHKYYQAGKSLVPSRYHSRRVLLHTSVLSTVVLFFLFVIFFSFSAVASSFFLVL